MLQVVAADGAGLADAGDGLLDRQRQAAEFLSDKPRVIVARLAGDLGQQRGGLVGENRPMMQVALAWGPVAGPGGDDDLARAVVREDAV